MRRPQQLPDEEGQSVLLLVITNVPLTSFSGSKLNGLNIGSDWAEDSAADPAGSLVAHMSR